MRISEPPFQLELTFQSVGTAVLESRVFLQLAPGEVAYEEHRPLLTRPQLESWVAGLQGVLAQSTVRYDSAFEDSPLATSVEQVGDQWLVTIVIAPQAILIDSTQAVGIDLLAMTQLDSANSQAAQPQTGSSESATEGHTVEIELLLSNAEFAELIMQLQADLDQLPV